MRTALPTTVAATEGRGVKVTSALVDVADRAAVEAWADDVVVQHGAVHLVVNNAGVALSTTVEAMSYEDLEWLMGINFWGVVHGTKAFLPHLMSAGEGHVVNISSVFGLIGIPSQSAYNAAKFAVRGFTDSLRIELDASGAVSPPRRCTPAASAPTSPATPASTRAPSPSPGSGTGDRGVRPDAAHLAEDAAAQILTAVRRNRRRALIGPDAVVFDLVSRLPAGVYQRVLVLGSRLRR